MADEQAISWESLNAYVDGELAPADAAAVALAAARDPAIAARIASLAKLRSVVRALPQEQAPPLVLPSVFMPQRRAAALVAWAACLMMAAVLAAGVNWLTGRDVAAGEGLAAAVLAQREWLASSKPGPRLHVNLIADDHGLLDLSAASLRLAYLSLDPVGAKGGGVLAGYIGPNGCRLGFWMGRKRPARTRSPHRADREGLKISTWISNEREYALISLDLDSGRLDEIAEIVASLPLVRGRPGEAQIARIQALHPISHPCAA